MVALKKQKPSKTDFRFPGRENHYLEEKNTMAKLVKEEVIAGLKEMNRAEIRDLVSAIETEFGVKAADR